MNQIKAAVIDFDGTLYDYRYGKIHESTIEAVRELKRRGITVIIASSRAYPELSMACIQQIAADYYVAASGHSIQDAQGRPIFSERFSYEQTEYLAEVTRKFHAGLTLKYDTYTCLYSQPEEMEKIFSNAGPSGASCLYCTAMNHHAKELPLGFTIRAENGMRDILCDLLEEKTVDFRTERYGNGTVADVYHPQVNKMTALTYLFRRLGLEAENCIAFGDGHNDMQMLRWAGIGVAMGNAKPELKDAADRVCGASWEEGISLALKELNLI